MGIHFLLFDSFMVISDFTNGANLEASSAG